MLSQLFRPGPEGVEAEGPASVPKGTGLFPILNRNGSSRGFYATAAVLLYPASNTLEMLSFTESANVFLFFEEFGSEHDVGREGEEYYQLNH